MKKIMKVGLKGVKFYAHHGYYEEEAILGNHYIIDVMVETDFSAASQSDDLAQTVNYEKIYQTCSVIMEKRVKLLEKISEQIIASLKGQYPEIQKISVRIQKLNPPFGGDVYAAVIEQIQDFSK
ncbi:MAG: dihydroneopterin aldolase [Cognaticolwellia sp.]|jgi:dihydroneopterin aldolase